MRTKPHEPTHRSPAMGLDWATAATEARRQRDAEVKATQTKRYWQKRAEAAAWSPRADISRIRKA